jgi:hypothetical protein
MQALNITPNFAPNATAAAAPVDNKDKTNDDSPKPKD